MEVRVDDVVMPGDIVKEAFPKIKVILGPGLRRDGDNVFVCKAGVLKKRDPFTYYVNSYDRRYNCLDVYVNRLFYLCTKFNFGSFWNNFE